VTTRARLGRLFGITFLTLIVMGLLAPVALAQSVVDCPTCAVDDTIEETTGTVEETVDKTTGDGGSGGGGNGGGGIDELDPTDDDFLGEDFLTDDIPDVVGEIVEPEEKKKKKNKEKESTGGRKDPVRPQNTGSATYFPANGKIGGLTDREAAAAGHYVARAQDKRQLSEAETAGAFTTGLPSLEELAEALAETAKQLAFPLGLALAVVAYLMIQGRIDAKDPKLALAAVDAEEEYLAFS
jgi:hypothetical protein